MDINKITKEISEKIVKRILGTNKEDNKILRTKEEDNMNINEALIELNIKVKANFIKDSSSLSVCFPVPIPDKYHTILEYKFFKNKANINDEQKIEDNLALLNFKKSYKKGDKEECAIYFKIKSQKSSNIHDLKELNLEKFSKPQKYTTLSEETKKFVENFRDKNVRKIVDKISTWIFSNLRYVDIDEMKTAEWIFKNRYGNCVHYSTLFLAFCRYFEIPCRFVLGFASYGKFYPHTWVEFYDAEANSWIPVDVALNQKFFVDVTHIPISRFDKAQIKRYFKEVNLTEPDDYDECFKIINFGTGSVVEEDAHVEIDVNGKIIKTN